MKKKLKKDNMEQIGVTMSEEEKKRLKEYQKNYREVRLSQNNNYDIIIKLLFNCNLIVILIAF